MKDFNSPVVQQVVNHCEALTCCLPALEVPQSGEAPDPHPVRQVVEDVITLSFTIHGPTALSAASL